MQPYILMDIFTTPNNMYILLYLNLRPSILFRLSLSGSVGAGACQATTGREVGYTLHKSPTWRWFSIFEL